MTTRRACLLAIALLPVLGLAEVRYTVTPMTVANKIKVTMSFTAEPGALELQMPNWSPGAYILSNHGRNVADFVAKDAGGHEVKFSHPGQDTWSATVPGGVMSVEYSVPSTYADGAIHYSGPSTYMYVVGRKEEACRLTLDTPKDWKVAVGLDAVGESYSVYKAQDYDVLADNPVTIGDFIELRYESHGKPHTIAMRGAYRGNVDREKIVRVCKAISDGQGDFFGGLPFNKYVWHFAVTPAADGGGGLEHLTSTQISLAQGVGPVTIRVCAHEYFHLWNVKRIRSRVLGPFDYTKLPKTGALYWLEGVTDYYSSLLSMRYGPLDEKAFLGDLIQNTRSVRSNLARLRVSPYESSMRVDETNGGRGNSNGYEISYYNLGWLVGLVLDIELRSRSGGKRSLDEAMKILWQMCKDDAPGFQENEIRNIMLQLGGPTMGDFFDKVVMKPGELPLEEQLSKIGYKLESTERGVTEVGFDFGPMPGGAGVRVFRTLPAINQAVLANDQILSVNGTEITGKTSQEMLASARALIATLKPGVEATMRVKRDGKDVDVKFTPREEIVTEYNLTDVANGDAAKLALRKGLFYAGKK
jgi:predicted metalloprotease with PDZ domain